MSNKNYVAKADKKTSSTDRQYSMFVGRWQPLHDGHKWMFKQAMDEGKNVLICIRDVKPDEKNPFTPNQVFNKISWEYRNEIKEERVKVMVIPDIESVNYGRGVGYDVIEWIPPTEIADISATKIRESMIESGQLTIKGKEQAPVPKIYTTEQLANYTGYLAEQVNNGIKYSEHIATKLDELYERVEMLEKKMENEKV